MPSIFTQVAWSPFHESVLATCCIGNEPIVMLWDMERIGAVQVCTAGGADWL